MGKSKTYVTSDGRGLLVPAAEQQGAVGAAEAEGVRHGIFEFGFAGVVGDQVHAGGVRVWILQVDGWRQNLVTQCEHGDAGFESSSAAEQVSSHRLGGTHGEFVLTEEVADGVGFERVADGG